jgi:hypothetical protein
MSSGTRRADVGRTPVDTAARTEADSSPEDVTPYRDRPSDDGKRGQKANRSDAPAAQSSLGNFAGEDLQPDHPVRNR